MSQTDLHKFDFIDAVRGLAILGVVLVHTAQWIVPANPMLKQVAENGGLGVQLFFIASALTLFLSLKSRRAKEQAPYRNFFIRRFFRVAPIFYLALIASMLLRGTAAQYWAPFGVQWWYPIATALFLNGWFPDMINAIVPGGWSIAVEMTFYLFVPLLFSRIKSIRAAVLFIGIALALRLLLNQAAGLIFQPFYPPNLTYMLAAFQNFWFFAQLPVFGIGILVFQFFVRYKERKSQALGYVLLLAALGLISIIPVSTNGADVLPYYFLISGAFGLLTLGLYFSETKILVNFVTCWIGKLSFSIYFIHFFVISFLQTLLPLAPQGDGELALGYLAVVLLSVLFALFTYHFVEKIGMALGKAIIEKLEKPDDPVEAPPGLANG